jgi:hypothetical protein
MVINNRLVDVFDKQIKPQQFGLKKNSRTSDGFKVDKREELMVEKGRVKGGGNEGRVKCGKGEG